MLAGCAPFQPERAAESDPGSRIEARGPAPVEDRTDVDALLGWLARHAGHPPSSLQPAFNGVSERFERNGDVGSRLELAWLLAQPGTDFQDRSRAAKLLDEYIKDPGAATELVPLATLLRAQIRQQNRRINALAEAHEQLVDTRSEKQALEIQVETLTRLLEILQQQFEELKEIERDVN